jgi:vacuolar-type H+-ATPase subunit H
LGPIEEFALKVQLISQETLRASLSAWLDFWTYLIVVGVALEIIDWVWEYASNLKDFWRGVIHTPEEPSFVKFSIGLMAIALVVTGVAGEWYLQVRIGEAESKIEQIADSLEESTSSKLRDTVRDVGDTKTAAKQSAVAAEQASVQAGIARRRAEAIGKQATQLASDLRKTAEAQEKAAAAQLELNKYLETKTNARWKNLTVNTDLLKGSAKAAFEILYVPNDEDGFTFSTLLAKMLGTSGWTFLGIRPLKDSDAVEGVWNIPNAPLAFNAGAWYGISFNVKSPPPYPPFGHEKDCPVCALVSAIAGGFKITADPRLPEGVVRIVVGQRQ